jgi:alkanesulfonate monooxygenase SsuD/methylene tetrahydromethanopterin reductase-like flavin-dependent oxidoreductase (luciferase family)
MLKIAGEHADGTILWMADERAIGDHVVPKITAAAQAAGRKAPRVVAGIPVCLCSPSQADEARARANRILGEAEISPNYQRILEHGDARDIGDLCAVGDEAAITARFKSFADAGVLRFSANWYCGTDLAVDPAWDLRDSYDWRPFAHVQPGASSRLPGASTPASSLVIAGLRQP